MIQTSRHVGGGGFHFTVSQTLGMSHYSAAVIPVLRYCVDSICQLPLSSSLTADLMPSFIRHGPTIPRRTEVSLQEMGPSTYPVAPNRDPAVSRNKSFLRTPVPRPPQEVERRESHRMSAPPYLPRSLGDLPHEYGGSSQSFLTDVSPMSENGDAARFYYPSESFYESQQRQHRRVPERFPEDYRYYEHSEHNFQRFPRQHTPPAPSRSPSGICLFVVVVHLLMDQKQETKSKRLFRNI